MRSLLVIVLLTRAVSAQPTGDELLDKFGLAEVRALTGEIARLATAEPLDDARYAAVIALRAKHPILGRLGALDDAQLAVVAAALCADAACITQTTRALRCLADRCAVALTASDPGDPDVLAPEPECMPDRRRKRAPLLGAGFDWGTGIQRSAAPHDGDVSTFGISARLRWSERYGFVVRADRTTGRDEATDADRDGVDDFESNGITRFTALAGPTVVLDSTRLGNTTRSVRLDLLAGYLATKTLPGEDGLAVGADLAMQLSIFRMGVRIVQGFGEAKHATNVVVHLGLTVGATPTRTEVGACPPRPRRSSRLALGFEIPISGAGFSSQLGYMALGLGAELVWHLSHKLDAIVRADVLGFPRRDKDRVTHQAALVGVRIDHFSKRRRARTGWYSTLMAGVTHGADLEPSTVGDGPIVDASIAWGGQDDEFAANFRLHARFGLSPDNEDYRAVFLAFGWELRFDRERWHDRDRSW